jgi:hypothetical protein
MLHRQFDQPAMLISKSGGFGDQPDRFIGVGLGDGEVALDLSPHRENDLGFTLVGHGKTTRVEGLGPEQGPADFVIGTK